jgi:hypothetical protein
MKHCFVERVEWKIEVEEFRLLAFHISPLFSSYNKQLNSTNKYIYIYKSGSMLFVKLAFHNFDLENIRCVVVVVVFRA